MERRWSGVYRLEKIQVMQRRRQKEEEPQEDEEPEPEQYQKKKQSSEPVKIQREDYVIPAKY